MRTKFKEVLTKDKVKNDKIVITIYQLQCETITQVNDVSLTKFL